MTRRASALARAGLVGHPSDAYGGVVLAVTLRDLAAAVSVEPSDALDVAPADRDGWRQGGDPLVRAAVARFARDCAPLHTPVRIRYRSAIPREVGLGGSSAIVIATLRALAQLTGTEIEPDRLAAIALAVETEDLGIAAGPQDRVVQAHGGLVYMDFARDVHEPLDRGLLPPLFVAWRTDAAGPSGSAHADVRARFERGEPRVVAAMRTLAGLAREARAALLDGDTDAFAAALDAGYDVRAAIFTLDPRHTAMIARARALGLHATYTGSGGAIVGIATDPGAVAALRGDGVEVAPAAA